MHKQFAIITVAAAFSASAAIAGGYEPPVVEAEPQVIAPAPVMPTSWAGGYVGGNVSFGKGKVTANGDWADALDAAEIGHTLAKPDGASAAIRAGYDWQVGSGVFGVGGEYNAGKYKADLNSAVAAELGAADDVSVRIKNPGTIFARAGYAVNDDFMAYGLLGYTWAKGEATNVGGVTESRDLDGATYGLGAEYKFTPNWSSYVEYTHTNFGKVKDTDDNVKAKLGQIKIGANFRF